MKGQRQSPIVLILAAVLAAACASPAGGIAITPTPEPTAEGGRAHEAPVTDFDSLLQNLRVAGGTVEATGETIEQPFFSVPARVAKFNDADLQVFEYASEADAAADAALVAPDGRSVGTGMVTWVATPHFYRAGRFIVLYVGDDAATLGMLEGALGEPFAGGEAPGDDAGAVPTACVPQGPDRLQYVNPTMGYCLLHPARFTVNVVEVANVLIEGPAIGEGPQPMRAGVQITVVPAEGRSVSQVVDQVASEYAGLPITRTPGALGGEAAEIVEGLPGVTGSRDVFAVLEDKVYRLRFYPADPAFPQVAPDVDELWEAVSASFAFLPKAFTLGDGGGSRFAIVHGGAGARGRGKGAGRVACLCQPLYHPGDTQGRPFGRLMARII